MARPCLKTYYPSYKDKDSAIGFGYDYSSSNELNSSRLTLNRTFEKPQSKTILFPIPGVTIKKRTHTKPLIRFPWDGKVERIRPATMKNSENGDYILCDTDRGAYVAYRTPLVPEWVKELVNQIEAEQR
ncbi:unnamed protein product [Rotaria socialis]|uniref:Uncharacterized protein n=2 Tax=Rotaria socialis TaxID=392032 RepID=A0A817RFQ7_9BILA|nr:unnamed protein product [Rotaria socialis]CAF3313827.1 unnamed protein product [Rotaria socialis]CAF3369309.1 unnamed protein product [Rotaria socialis]CAF4099657.1 unnamed protein product [Rotaria socialis]CAF4472137.1 unnamed protein product [Rotaria socialis]